MTYLVTGGCGFIGSHICEALVDRDDTVIVYDNLASGYEHNLDGFRDKVRFIQADVRDPEALAKAMDGVDYVFHEAALVSVFDSVDRPQDNHEINITGTLNVLEAARQAGVKRVVMACTAAAYGNNPELPKREDMRPEPESPYGLAKVTGEYYLRIYAQLYGLETVALRYFNVYGPRQDPSSMYSGVISKFSELVNQQQAPTIFGDGLQTRDFVYVKDVVQGNLLAMAASDLGQGEVLNIATGEQTSLLDLLAVLNDLTDQQLEPTFKDARAGDVKHSVAAIDRAKETLGYAPAYDLHRGLNELLASL